jgi:hypothetical protein
MNSHGKTEEVKTETTILWGLYKYKVEKRMKLNAKR